MQNYAEGKELVEKRQEKYSSENVICCKNLPNITDELSIEANSVDPEQTAPCLIWATLFAIEAS